MAQNWPSSRSWSRSPWPRNCCEGRHRRQREGGGVMGQAEATRTAIAKAMVEFFQDEALKRRSSSTDRVAALSDIRDVSCRRSPSDVAPGRRDRNPTGERNDHTSEMLHMRESHREFLPDLHQEGAVRRGPARVLDDLGLTALLLPPYDNSPLGPGREIIPLG